MLLTERSEPRSGRCVLFLKQFAGEEENGNEAYITPHYCILHFFFVSVTVVKHLPGQNVTCRL